MSSNVRIELNRSEVRKQLLKSKEMQSIVLEQAQAMAARTGGTAESKVWFGRNRVNAAVIGDNGNNSLLKAMR